MALIFTLRPATQYDSALIAHQRNLMFDEDKIFSTADLTEMEHLYEPWVAEKLAIGDYQGWFAENQVGEVIGGVGLWLREWPPILKNYTGKQGYIENVFTHHAYRRQGVSRQLMMALLDWVRVSKACYEIELHPTDLARPLYASLGFEGHTGAMTQWFGPKSE